MTGPEIAFHVSDVRVIVRANEPDLLLPLELVWGNAGPLLSPVRTVTGTLRTSAGEATVRLEEARVTCASSDGVPAFEQLLYEAIPSWHPPPRTLLHAAAVSHEGTVFLFSGASGCGKSSLALAMVERGASYLTDELVVFDGGRLWGIPRAPQFEPVAPGTPLPARLEATDRTTYRFRGSGGEALVLPIRRLPAASVAAGPYAPGGVRVVFPAAAAGGEPQPVTLREALRRLLEETRSDVGVDLGPLLVRPPMTLPWNDVSQATRVLMGW